MALPDSPLDGATSAPFAQRLPDEARDLVAAAAERGLAVRVLGGVGIGLALGDRCHRVFQRSSRDLDLIVRRAHARKLEELLEERGWDPAAAFNALNVERRLLFHDPHGQTHVDVYVETFEMCHTLPLADSLDRPGPSLPVTDLLMSKLQIVSPSAKDMADCLALLHGCPVADGDPAGLEPARLAALTAEEWGLHHTFELALARLRDDLALEERLSDDDRATTRERLEAIAHAMAEVPKSGRWRLRARIGERRSWHEEPEEPARGPGA
jgi:hypothetical protein